MTAIRVFVRGDPKGQPRTRAFYRKGLGVRVYDPGTAEGWKAEVALALRPLRPPVKTADPIRLELWFTMARPKSHYRKAGGLTTTAPRAHTATPDADNLAKAVMDAISHLDVWVDDAQVVGLIVSKRWAMNQQEPAGCEINISTQ